MLSGRSQASQPTLPPQSKLDRDEAPAASPPPQPELEQKQPSFLGGAINLLGGLLGGITDFFDGGVEEPAPAALRAASLAEHSSASSAAHATSSDDVLAS